MQPSVPIENYHDFTTSLYSQKFNNFQKIFNQAFNFTDENCFRECNEKAFVTERALLCCGREIMLLRDCVVYRMLVVCNES